MITYFVWDIDPKIFDAFELRWYGLSWAIGMMLGYQVMSQISKRDGLSQPDLDWLTFYLALGAIVGARLGHILFYDAAYYLNNPIEILPMRMEPEFQFTGLLGLASHGGVAGALFALYLYKQKYKYNFLWTLDRVTIAGALLGGFIRLGNLMNSEIIGIPTHVPWAFVFTRIDQTPRHPTQLYEAIFYLAIFAVLYYLWKWERVQKYPGFLFGCGLSLIFAQRFLMEFLKEDQVAFEKNLMLNMGQTLSLPLIGIGILIMMWSFKKLPTNVCKI